MPYGLPLGVDCERWIGKRGREAPRPWRRGLTHIELCHRLQPSGVIVRATRLVTRRAQPSTDTLVRLRARQRLIDLETGHSPQSAFSAPDIEVNVPRSVVVRVAGRPRVFTCIDVPDGSVAVHQSPFSGKREIESLRLETEGSRLYDLALEPFEDLTHYRSLPPWRP